MPTVTLTDIPFPSGTSVGAYLKDAQTADVNGRGPLGATVASSTVAADRTLTFTNLEAGEQYVAAGLVDNDWRYASFAIDAAPHLPMFADEDAQISGQWTFLTTPLGLPTGGGGGGGSFNPADNQTITGLWTFTQPPVGVGDTRAADNETITGTWTFTTPPAGFQSGSVWRTGSGAPSGSLGIVGDWYINQTNGDTYEKTGASTYTLRFNMTGPTGPSGAGTGDMVKATYDPNTDGVIDIAQGGTGATTAGAARTALGAGTGDMVRSTYDPNTDGIIALAQGGTGATTAPAARTALGAGDGDTKAADDETITGDWTIDGAWTFSVPPAGVTPGGGGGETTSPVFNIVDYGAVGDGTTNAVTAINAAINAALASSGSGGVVTASPGVYAINAAITIPNGVSLQCGYSDDTGATGVSFLCTASGAQLKFTGSAGLNYGFTVNGNGAAAEPLRIDSSFGLTFENVNVNGGFNDNIMIFNATQATLIGCNSSSSGRDCIVLDGSTTGCLLVRCRARAIGRHGIYVGSVGGSNGTGPGFNYFGHCVVEQVSGASDDPLVKVARSAGTVGGLGPTLFDSCSITGLNGTAASLVNVDEDVVTQVISVEFRSCNFVHSGTGSRVGLLVDILAAGNPVHVTGITSFQGLMSAAVRAVTNDTLRLYDQISTTFLPAGPVIHASSARVRVNADFDGTSTDAAFVSPSLLVTAKSAQKRFYRSDSTTVATDDALLANGASLAASGFINQTATGGTGYIIQSEQTTTPTAPAANRAVLFARDDGAGNTQFAARFPTGSVVPIATEGGGGAGGSGAAFSATGTGGAGYFEAVEQSTPPSSPAADTGRLFFKDNGLGKTELCVKFATGSHIVLATQP